MDISAGRIQDDTSSSSEGNEKVRVYNLSGEGCNSSGLRVSAVVSMINHRFTNSQYGEGVVGPSGVSDDAAVSNGEVHKFFRQFMVQLWLVLVKHGLYFFSDNYDEYNATKNFVWIVLLELVSVGVEEVHAVLFESSLRRLDIESSLIFCFLRSVDGDRMDFANILLKRRRNSSKSKLQSWSLSISHIKSSI